MEGPWTSHGHMILEYSRLIQLTNWHPSVGKGIPMTNHLYTIANCVMVVMKMLRMVTKMMILIISDDDDGACSW